MVPSVLGQHDHGGMSMPPSTETMSRPKTGSLKGRIVELRKDSIVVDAKHDGKQHRMTIMTDTETKREGILAVGSEVQIKYREEPEGVFFATSLKGPKSKGD
jgi:hypothetical protein